VDPEVARAEKIERLDSLTPSSSLSLCLSPPFPLSPSLTLSLSPSLPLSLSPSLTLSLPLRRVEEEPEEVVDPEVARAEKIERLKQRGNKAFTSQAHTRREFPKP
jgi:hypothetical protein